MANALARYSSDGPFYAIDAMTDQQSMILRFPASPVVDEDPIVITGIGMGASLGSSREVVWQAVQAGKSGIRECRESDGIGSLRLPCGMVDWLERDPHNLKSILCAVRSFL